MIEGRSWHGIISVVAIQRHLANLQQHHVPILQTIHQIIGVRGYGWRLINELSYQANFGCSGRFWWHWHEQRYCTILCVMDLYQHCCYCFEEIVLAWNHHDIPGNSGVPNLLASTHRSTTQVSTWIYRVQIVLFISLLLLVISHLSPLLEVTRAPSSSIPSWEGLSSHVLTWMLYFTMWLLPMVQSFDN